MPERSVDVTIRQAMETDRRESVELYRLSQEATGIPDPAFVSPDTLESRLYGGLTVRRYVAEHAGRIVGHALVELPNPANIPMWVRGTNYSPGNLLELGRAFVHPDLFRNGIWTELLNRRLVFVRSVSKIAVSATWSQNEHVKQAFLDHGGVHVGDKTVADGDVSLYRFTRKVSVEKDRQETPVVGMEQH